MKIPEVLFVKHCPPTKSIFPRAKIQNLALKYVPSPPLYDHSEPSRNRPGTFQEPELLPGSGYPDFSNFPVPDSRTVTSLVIL